MEWDVVVVRMFSAVFVSSYSDFARISEPNFPENPAAFALNSLLTFVARLSHTRDVAVNLIASEIVVVRLMTCSRLRRTFIESAPAAIWYAFTTDPYFDSESSRITISRRTRNAANLLFPSSRQLIRFLKSVFGNSSQCFVVDI